MSSRPIPKLTMTSSAPVDVLVIAASNGENLKLAERFADETRKLGSSAEVLDLTLLDLPLYRPKAEKNGNPVDLARLQERLTAAPHWVICAPEYNGSIPPVFSNAVAWLSVQGDDFRALFNGRPIAMATFSGGGGMELLLSLRIQLTHLGAQVVGRQLLSNFGKPAKDESIQDLLRRLLQMQPLELGS